MSMYLGKNIKVTSGITVTAGASSSSDVTGSTLDMAGWDGVLAVCMVGPVTSGAATSFRWAQDTDSAMGTAADLLASGVTVADTDDNTIFLLDLHRPQERYVRIIAKRATQASTCAVTYIQYKGDNLPSTHATSVTSVAYLHSPAEGTA